MKKFKNIVITFMISVLFIGCANDTMFNSSNTMFNSNFTTKNALKIKVGMHSSEILKTFGEPKSITSDICGGATGKPWQCIEWKYSDFCLQGNCFTFQTKDGELYLNSWQLNDLN